MRIISSLGESDLETFTQISGRESNKEHCKKNQGLTKTKKVWISQIFNYKIPLNSDVM